MQVARGVDGITYGGNMNDAATLRMAMAATEYLYNALVNQVIAAMVPDDLRGLNAA